MDFIGFYMKYTILGIFFSFDCYNSFPITGDISTRKGQWEYLKEYKHVPSHINSRQRSTSSPEDASFSAAVSSYQRFFKLPVTGRVDPATLALMKQPRCQMPDDNENDREGRFFQGSSWKENPLTYKLRVYPAGNKPNGCAARARLTQAFQIWQYAIQKDFEEVESTANIDTSFVRLAHGDNDPFDGPGKTLAHAFYPNSGGDIHVDNDDKFSGALFTPHETHSLLYMYIHEIGHSLGLRHSGDSRAVMWPYIMKGKVFAGLGSNDLDAIRSLYGARQRPLKVVNQPCVEYTERGAKCVFPFRYRGRTFTECTTFDHPRKWCSLTSTFIGLWGNCMGCLSNNGSTSCRPSEKTGTFKGTALGVPCHFPFTYKGVTYNTCTVVDHFRPWCSTTANYEGCWGNCMGCEGPPQLATCEETTVDGRHCVFPFFYKQKLYYSCTKTDHHRPWCSHNAVFAKRWSHCNDCPSAGTDKNQNDSQEMDAVWDDSSCEHFGSGTNENCVLLSFGVKLHFGEIHQLVGFIFGAILLKCLICIDPFLLDSL